MFNEKILNQDNSDNELRVHINQEYQTSLHDPDSNNSNTINTFSNSRNVGK